MYNRPYHHRDREREREGSERHREEKEGEKEQGSLGFSLVSVLPSLLAYPWAPISSHYTHGQRETLYLSQLASQPMTKPNIPSSSGTSPVTEELYFRGNTWALGFFFHFLSFVIKCSLSYFFLLV